MFRKLSTYVLFLLLGTPLAALAQGTGTLAGRVLDLADVRRYLDAQRG